MLAEAEAVQRHWLHNLIKPGAVFVGRLCGTYYTEPCKGQGELRGEGTVSSDRSVTGAAITLSPGRRLVQSRCRQAAAGSILRPPLPGQGSGNIYGSICDL